MTSRAGTPGAPDAGREGASAAAILDRIGRCVETIGLGFEQRDDPHARGPGLYFVIESASVAAFAEPMGANR